MIRIYFVIFLMGLSAEVSSQILPGMERKEIKSYIASSHSGYVLREPPNAGELDFMTFEHVSGDKTLLVFLSPEGVCTFTRLMVDLDYIEDLVSRYDREYEPAGGNSWTAVSRGEVFDISIEERDWMFTVTVRKREN